MSVTCLVSQILVGGCGNSELSEQLYDVSYRHLTNIDISETVVNHMNQKNAKLHQDLTFQKVDATQTPYEDGSYQVTLDKGTLDAVASQEEGVLAGRMLAEVGWGCEDVELLDRDYNRALTKASSPAHRVALQECCLLVKCV